MKELRRGLEIESTEDAETIENKYDEALAVMANSDYANGRGVPQDDGKAVEWWQKSAEQGHAKAHFALQM